MVIYMKAGDRFKPGDIAIIKKGTENYCGIYVDTNVRIISIDTDYSVTAKTFDGKEFMFPSGYLLTFKEYCATTSPCECGNPSTDKHYEYCPRYRR